MKHKWIIKPRGKKTKYYICARCGERAVGSSIKGVNEIWTNCNGNHSEENTK